MAVTKKKSPNFSLIGFNTRKMLFFLGLFLVSYIFYNSVLSNQFKADVSNDTGSQNLRTYSVTIKIEKDGSLIVNDKAVKDRVDLVENEVRLKILDNSGVEYDKVRVALISPKNNAKDIVPQVVAQHGVGDNSTSVKNSNTVQYEINNVSSYGTVTIVAKLPPSTVSPGVVAKLQAEAQKTKYSFWLWVATIFPIITLVLMVMILVYKQRRQKIDLPKTATTQPPMAIPPSVVGALFNQKVGPREIAATLLDLAQRGDIVIIDGEAGFSFGKGRFDQRLLAFEKILLSKIFKENLSSNRQDLEKRLNDHFYSKKMSMVTSGIYALATRLGYFKIDPQKSLLKYRLVGIFCFLVATAGFVLSLVKFTEPPFAIFLWVGMMISALIISVIAGHIPIRTIIGQEVLSNWLAFRKFLSDPDPFPYSEGNQDIFQKYLPYAIVLDCESAWARRFEDHNFIIPEWFYTEKIGLGLEDFCLSLFPIISYVGRSLAAIREPGFE